MLFPHKIHRYIFLFALALIASSLPLSRYTLSVGIIMLAINWLIEGRWDQKTQIIAKHKSLLAFLLIYATYLGGMIHTSNMSYGWQELQQKLPLLFFPLVFSTSDELSKKETFILSMLFCAAVIIGSFYSTFLFISNYWYGGSNVRSISPFISHIRFALMVNLSIFISGYYFFRKPTFLTSKYRFVLLFSAIWLASYLFVLQSLTGFVVFVFSLLLTLIIVIVRSNKLFLKVSSFSIISLIVLFSAGYVFFKSKDYFHRREVVDLSNLPLKTSNGYNYSHETDYIQYENGYLVWINICWPELEKEWSKSSELPFYGKDKLGQNLRFTLIRYMTSLGLKKDSTGFSQLDDVDIKMVESGATSVVFREKKFGIYPRLYQLLWEIDQYIHFNQISGSPFIQRLVYLKAALYNISSNFWFGVGIGDYETTFKKYYSENVPNLSSRYYRIAHNQFLTHWSAVGLIGFSIFVFAWFFPFFWQKLYLEYLPTLFLVIITLSMLNEDTFETHIGVSFAAFFYSFYMFSKKTDN